MTATAAGSSFPLERRDYEDGHEIAAAPVAELPARKRGMLMLPAILLVAEMSWLAAIGYGLILLAR